MARRTHTRERLLHTAARLFQQQGYAATGLTQVLAESEAPKGVFYFHFPAGKQQLAAEAISFAGGERGSRMASALADAPSARAAVEAMGELLASDLESSGFRDGCPVATVALDAADESDQVREACRNVYSAWATGLQRYLRGQGVPQDKAGDLTLLIHSSLEGALLLARLNRDADLVRNVAHQLGELVQEAATS